MSGTHGELFSEIGAIVVAAFQGEPIDLDAKAEELAARYANLHVPADLIARAIARSAGAVGVSMALLGRTSANGAAAVAEAEDEILPADAEGARGTEKSVLLPSGVRLAVLS